MNRLKCWKTSTPTASTQSARSRQIARSKNYIYNVYDDEEFPLAAAASEMTIATPNSTMMKLKPTLCRSTTKRNVTKNRWCLGNKARRLMRIGSVSDRRFKICLSVLVCGFVENTLVTFFNHSSWINFLVQEGAASSTLVIATSLKTKASIMSGYYTTEEVAVQK